MKKDEIKEAPEKHDKSLMNENGSRADISRQVVNSSPDFKDDPREAGSQKAVSIADLFNSPDIKSVHPAGTAAGQSSLFTQSERDKLIAEIKRYPAEAVAKARAAILPVDRV